MRYVEQKSQGSADDELTGCSYRRFFGAHRSLSFAIRAERLAVASHPELMPQDLKLEIDRLSRQEAVASARYLAEVVCKAHARQMDAATRKEFRATFKSRSGSRLEAPSWLWSGVVELISAHEAAYLEHCRRYALA